MKLTNFTVEDIEKYLEEMRNLIKDNRYNIEVNVKREENKDFIEDYNIDTKKEKEILLSLEYTDFCYAVNNTTNDPRYSHEVLYIFNKNYKLYKIGEECGENLDIYIKTNKIDTKLGKRIIVISFHKRNKDIQYYFRQ